MFCIKSDKNISAICKLLKNNFKKLILCSDKEGYLVKVSDLLSIMNEINIEGLSVASIEEGVSLLKEYNNPVMVQSIDGVGTKTIIARKMNKFDTIGIDLLSAAANDILVMGAKPLTFLDYIANDKLKPEVIKEIVSGMVKACRETGVSLVGGETAEMPDTYLPGEHDLVGIITGIVEKDKIITGENIERGDVLLGIPSNGLHTNGYSFARKLFFDSFLLLPRFSNKEAFLFRPVSKMFQPQKNKICKNHKIDKNKIGKQS